MIEFAFSREILHLAFVIIYVLILLCSLIYIIISYTKFLHGELKKIILSMIAISVLIVLSGILHIVEEIIEIRIKVIFEIVLILMAIFMIILAKKLKNFANVFGFKGAKIKGEK
jgi:hypothetical protein